MQEDIKYRNVSINIGFLPGGEMSIRVSGVQDFFFTVYFLYLKIFIPCIGINNLKIEFNYKYLITHSRHSVNIE